MLPFILKEFIASKLGGKTKVQFDISEFYSLKMQALACYKTQTETYEGEPPPLSVSFLQNFQKRYEEFWTYVHPKQNP
jgi:LmbE family N-acetylglucosaminyl deacetylase